MTWKSFVIALDALPESDEYAVKVNTVITVALKVYYFDRESNYYGTIEIVPHQGDDFLRHVEIKDFDRFIKEDPRVQNAARVLKFLFRGRACRLKSHYMEQLVKRQWQKGSKGMPRVPYSGE